MPAQVLAASIPLTCPPTRRRCLCRRPPPLHCVAAGTPSVEEPDGGAAEPAELVKGVRVHAERRGKVEEATVQGVVGAVYEVILSVCYISNFQLCCHVMNHKYPKLMFICRVRVWPQALWLAEPSTRTMVVFSYSGLKGLQIKQ